MKITEKFLQWALDWGAEWVMVLIVGCSFISWLIILERLIIFSKWRGSFSIFMEDLLRRIQSGEPRETIAAWCAGSPLMEAKIAAVGLESVDEKSASEGMQGTLILMRNQLLQRLTILGTLGNNIPFVGLLGTIIGVIQAFHALSTTTSMNPNVIMASISEALVATGVALLATLPSVVMYNYFYRVLQSRSHNSQTVMHFIIKSWKN
jgi:biopolymer transport protein ExbB